MAKRVVAAMNIRHDGERINVDDPIDPKNFTKEQITRLYERGAVKIVDDAPVVREATLEETTGDQTKPEDQTESKTNGNNEKIEE